MSHETVNKNATIAIGEVCANFARNLGTKHEELLWGIKATREILDGTLETVAAMADHKKVAAVKVLAKADSDLSSLEVFAKGLQRNTLVYIPHADEWDQDVLLKVMALFGARESKCMLGFTEPSRLCFGIYMFLVSYQVDAEYKVSRWSLNMSAPIYELAALS
ncbi:hypothetical protein [Providencia sp. PROV255]|uniref:hypothetical protein n=1 Tax=Providencia sp. PROV255 TaxID=2949943 RepID=UPI0023491E1E|nr:hypothetical protein [Providencia sp. PROV255]